MPIPSRIGLQSHPPERRRRAPVTLYDACSCCCCCCLHTLGGLIGAMIGSQPIDVPGPAPPAQPLPPNRELAPRAPRTASIQRPPTDLTTGIARPQALGHELDEDEIDVRQPPWFSATGMFWFVSMVLTVLLLLGALIGGNTVGESLLLLLMCFPVVQFVSGVLVSIGFAILRQHDKDQQLRQLNKIMGGLLVGTFAGAVLTILACCVVR